MIDPKEIIGIVKIERWKTIKNFSKDLIQKTLTRKVPYDLIIQKGKSKEKESMVPTHTIRKLDQLNILENIADFKSISFYQSDGFIRNHIFISKKENVIILIAKYMAPEIEYNGKFDFLLKLDSRNHPSFALIDQDCLSCSDIVNLTNKNTKHLKLNTLDAISDNLLENYIFEQISGKNAIWGGSETKAFLEWKENAAKLFKEETNKNSFYSGTITKRYREYLEKMYKMWFLLVEELDSPFKSLNLNRLTRFLDTF